MHRLYITPSAEADLDKITALHEQDGYDLRAFIELLDGSESIIWRLSKWHTVHTYTDPQFDSQAIADLQSRGYNIYRLKVMQLEWARRHYRVIYAYDAEYEDFYVLAVFLRLTDHTPDHLRNVAYNYDFHHPSTQRLISDYEALELPVRH